ncbi:MAG UNVERIFIED_CONTAM: hypothetical protein LVT10_27215 [Anaerolineae bacterium]
MMVLQLNDWFLIGIIAVNLLLILSNRFPVDAVALLVLLMLGFSRILTPQQTLSGFSSNVVITLIALFILDAILRGYGHRPACGKVDQQYWRWVRSLSRIRVHECRAALSLVMNNVAAGAVLLPAAVRVGRASRCACLKLLIPLSFGTLLGEWQPI